ncbi:MAG: hypothetical protein IIB05_07460 [Bacteroidetes bacterium]|nr:hypothetical protein [Bacteroidota bacterium]
MIIENSKTAINIRLRAFLATLIVVALIVIIFTTRILINPVWGLNKTHWSFIIIGIFVLFLIVNYFRDFHYIYFSDSGDKIIFRFYSMQIFSGKKHSIEMYKKDFVKFETNSFLFRLKDYLVLYQKMQKGIAKYPPISITALSKQDKIKLQNQLSRYITKQQ